MLAIGVFGYLGDYLIWWLIYVSLLVHTWCFFKFFPRDRRRRLGLVAGNALVFACMLGLAAAVGETYLRFLSIETDAFGMSLPARRWFALHTQLNSVGCRDVEWTREKPAGVRRIAFVGDSFSYGWGIKRVEDRFPDRLQAEFDHRSPGTVEVMNLAKPGWGTDAQIQPIRDIASVYDVDEVVLCHVCNDIESLLPTRPGFNPTRPPDPGWLNPESSCLLDYLYRRIWLPRVPIIGYCKDRGVTLRVVLLPYIRTGGEKFHMSGIHATLGKFFEVNETQVLDLLPALARHDPDELVVNSQDAHPNELAHQLFAEAIWERFYAGGNP